MKMCYMFVVVAAAAFFSRKKCDYNYRIHMESRMGLAKNIEERNVNEYYKKSGGA